MSLSPRWFLLIFGYLFSITQAIDQDLQSQIEILTILGALQLSQIILLIGIAQLL